MSSQAGELGRVQQFRLIEPLGRGGMGIVYLAEGPNGERVALKTVAASAAFGEHALSGMRKEIHALSMAHHPGVVRIVDHGVHGGKPWYAMEHLEGRTLRDVLGVVRPDSGIENATTANLRVQPGEFVRKAVEHGGLSRPNARELAELMRVVAELCDALAYLHGLGIVHRDVKPDNIVISSDGKPVLVDFGLAARLRGPGLREVINVAGTAIGTTAYMAPEQIRGESVDARADLYSLGCILYEIATGRVPFVADNPSDVAYQHLMEPPLPPSSLVPEVHHGLEALILTLLAKDPRERIGYADDVVSRLASAGFVTTKEVRERPGYVYRPRFVGRDDVTAPLLARIREASHGQGVCLVVGGESGVGKTRLAGELATRAAQSGMRVVSAQCVNLAGAVDMTALAPRPLGPLRSLFEAVVDRCVERGPEESAFFGDSASILGAFFPPLLDLPGVEARPPAPALTPEGARQRVFSALREMIAVLADEEPLLLVVEDLQWADALTVSFLASMVPSFLREHAVAVVATHRPEARANCQELFSQPNVHATRLNRLHRDDVATMVADMLALHEAPDELVSAVFWRSGGVPFFVAEYVRAAVSEGVLARDFSGTWRLAERAEPDRMLAEQPTNMVLSRLDRLSAPASSLVCAAAVLGRDIELEHAFRVAALRGEERMSSLHELQLAHVIEPGETGTMRFVHDKLREASYQRVPKAQIAELHARAARAVGDTPARWAELAHHWRLAGELARAIDYLEKAADRAFTMAAYRDAAILYERALRFANDSPRNPSRLALWHRRCAEARWGVGEMEAAGTHAGQALALLGQPLPNSELGWGTLLAGQWVRRVVGRPGKSAAPAEAALAAARLAFHHYHQGRSTPVVAMALLAANRAESSDADVRIAQTYSQLGYVAGLFRMRKTAKRYFERARKNARATQDPISRAVCAYQEAAFYFGEGRESESRTAIEASLSSLQELGDVHELERAHSIAAHIKHSFGEVDGALEHATWLFESAGRRGSPMHQAWGAYTVGRGLLAKGELAEAADMLHSALVLLDEIPDDASKIITHGLSAQLHAERHDWQRSRSSIEQVLSLAGPLPMVFSTGHGFEAAATAARALAHESGDVVDRQLANATRRKLFQYSLVFPVGRQALKRLR